MHGNARIVAGELRDQVLDLPMSAEVDKRVVQCDAIGRSRGAAHCRCARNIQSCISRPSMIV